VLSEFFFGEFLGVFITFSIASAKTNSSSVIFFIFETEIADDSFKVNITSSFLIFTDEFFSVLKIEFELICAFVFTSCHCSDPLLNTFTFPFTFSTLKVCAKLIDTAIKNNNIIFIISIPFINLNKYLLFQPDL